MNEVAQADPITFLALILAGTFFVYLGWSHRVSKNDESSGKRTVSSKLLAPSLFVVIGSGEFGLAITLILAFGIGGISFLLGLAAAMLLISFLMKKIMKNVQHESLQSVNYDGFVNISTPDFIFMKFGKLSSRFSTFLTVIAFWGILLLQLLVGAAIISALSGVPQLWSVLLMATVVASYTSLGGFAALFYTDFWQGFLMFIALFTAALYLFFNHNDLPSYDFMGTLAFENLNTGIVIYLFFITIVAAFSGPDLWQRVNMASDEKSAKSGLRIAALGVFIFSLVLFLFAVDIKAVLSSQAKIIEGGELIQYLSIIIASDTQTIPPEFLWPEWLKIVFSIGLLSAFVSTADTSAMLVATSIQNEILRNKENKQPNKTTTKAIILLSCASAALASLLVTDIAEKFTAILGVLGVLGIPTLLALLGRGNKTTFMIATVAGSIILLLQVFYFPPEYNDNIYLFLPMLPGIICSFVSSK